MECMTWSNVHIMSHTYNSVKLWHQGTQTIRNSGWLPHMINCMIVSSLWVVGHIRKSVKLWGSIDQQSGTLSDHSLDIIDCMTPSSLQVMGHVIVWSYAFQSTNNQELWLVSPGHNRLYDNVKLTSHEAQNNVKLQGFSPSTTKE